jgi:hypothetical protein
VSDQRVGLLASLPPFQRVETLDQALPFLPP